jgi:hypothetical protein
MKLTVKKQGEYGTTETEGRDAIALIRQTLRKISDHCILSTDDGFPEEVVVKAKGKIKLRAVQTLKQGNIIWDELDEHGHPAMGCTILQLQPKIIGIIGADGTWEKVGDGPEQNPFEEKTDDQAKQP